MTNYNYDAINNTLTVTASFLKKAGIFNSAEYNIVKGIRADNPTVTIVKAEASKKNTKHHIKLAQMVEYIRFQDKLISTDEEQSTKYMDQYNKVKAMSKIQPSPYKYVEDWFKNAFPHWNEQVSFDDQGNMTFVSKSNEQKKTDAPAAENTPAIIPVDAETIVDKAA